MSRMGSKGFAGWAICVVCACVFTSFSIAMLWRQAQYPGTERPIRHFMRRSFKPLAGNVNPDAASIASTQGAVADSDATSALNSGNITAENQQDSAATAAVGEVPETTKRYDKSTEALLRLNRCEECNEATDPEMRLLVIRRNEAQREAGRLQCLRDIRERIVDDYRDFFADVNRVILVDVALHVNMGDSVLCRAALHLSSLFKHSVNYICAHSQAADGLYSTMPQFPTCNMSNIAELAKDRGLVLYQGGGNWGNLYRNIQEYRMQVFQYLGGNFTEGDFNFKVVQLPQSIAYTKETQTSIQADDRVMNGLPDGMLTAFFRQRDSLDFANAHYGANVKKKVSPDLALVLGPLTPIDEPAVDVLVLRRTDQETQNEDVGEKEQLKSLLDSSNVTHIIQDWGYSPRSTEFSAANPTMLSEVRLNEAINIVSKGKIVITNRMHGSLLATMTGRILLWVDTRQEKVQRTREVAFNVSDQCSDENLRAFKFPTILSAAEAAIQYLREESNQVSIQTT